jgi:branched-chain amino acid transport system substrate-binding protein
MNRIANLIFALFILEPAAACGASEVKGVIKIAVLAELTGDAATYGTDVKNGVLFANQKYGAGLFELIIEDTKCNGKEAANAAHKVVVIDKVKFVIGFGCSGALLSAAPILERAKVVVMGTAVRDYLYRHKFSHVIDNLGFDFNGDPTGIPLVLKIIKNSSVMPLR